MYDLESEEGENSPDRSPVHSRFKTAAPAPAKTSSGKDPRGGARKQAEPDIFVIEDETPGQVIYLAVVQQKQNQQKGGSWCAPRSCIEFGCTARCGPGNAEGSHAHGTADEMWWQVYEERGTRGGNRPMIMARRLSSSGEEGTVKLGNVSRSAGADSWLNGQSIEAQDSVRHAILNRQK